MDARMRFFEYITKKVENDDGSGRLQKTLTEWGKEGWEVISVIVPNPDNHSTFAITAKREILSQRTVSIGRKFR